MWLQYDCNDINEYISNIFTEILETALILLMSANFVNLVSIKPKYSEIYQYRTLSCHCSEIVIDLLFPLGRG